MNQRQGLRAGLWASPQQGHELPACAVANCVGSGTLSAAYNPPTKLSCPFNLLTAMFSVLAQHVHSIESTKWVIYHQEFV